jgi:two-component system response regulator AgrA
MDVYICENSKENLEKTTAYVQSIAKEMALKIMTATYEPEILLRKLRRKNKDIYLIALNLSAEKEGISVASAIRKSDPRGYIVLIVECEGAYSEILEAKIEALDIVQRGGEDYAEALDACFRYIEKRELCCL